MKIYTDQTDFELYDYYLEVARGNITGAIPVSKFGKNPDIDIGTEDIWSQGGTWVAPTTARVHNIKSSSTDDDGAPVGTGANTVKVYGLNGSYVLTEETVTMNGTTDVATANSHVIIYRMKVVTAGSGGKNAGTITATAVVDATVTLAIVIGKNQTQGSIYQVPAGYTGYLVSFGCGIDGGTTSNVDIELFVKPFGEVYQLKGTIMLGGSGTSSHDRHYMNPLPITEKSIIKLTGTSDTANMDVTGWWDMVMFPN
jgi:hypothetical protein